MRARKRSFTSTLFEREIMSTQKIIKRVAFVAAAALAIGGVTAISAQAANPNLSITTATTITNTATATQIAGPANYVTVTNVATSAVYFTLSGGLTTTAVSTGTVVASGTFNVATPTVGTITVSGYLISSGSASTTVTDLLTITVIAGLPGTIFNHSVVAIQDLVGGTPLNDATTDGTAVSQVSAASAVAAAQLTVSQYSSADSSQLVLDASTTAVTVAIAGAGAVGVATATNSTLGAAATRGPSATAAAGAVSTHGATGTTYGTTTFYVFPDGRTGVATLTVTVNGAVVATKTVTFVGALSKYILTAANTQKVYIGVGTTGTLTFTEVDANGNSVTPVSIYAAVSSNLAVATTTISGAVVSVLGVTSGTSNITITNAATPTVSLVVPVTVTKTTAAKVTLSFDAASYVSGTKATVTLTATDSTGAPVADGTYNLLGATGISPNLALVASNLPSTASVTLVGGIATYSGYVPDSSSTLTLSAVEGVATDDVIAARAPATIKASALLVSGSSNSIADATTAATVAATAAGASADAATAAAKAAGVQATAAVTAVAALTLQVKAILTKIAALSVLIVRIIKKVKA